MIKICKWCDCRPVTSEGFNEYCSKYCFHQHDADPCDMCNKNPGRICWELGALICSTCCKKEMARVKTEYEEVIKQEERLLNEQ